MDMFEFIKEILVEIGNSRSRTEDKITDESYQPLLHIIKILRYNNSIDYNHHISDIDGWLHKIEFYINQYNGKRLKSKISMNWIFYDNFKSGGFVNIFTKNEKYGVLKKYSDYQKLKTFEDIELQMIDIYDKLSKDLIDNKFETIENYL
jgi:hypothetical protein